LTEHCQDCFLAVLFVVLYLAYFRGLLFVSLL